MSKKLIELASSAQQRLNPELSGFTTQADWKAKKNDRVLCRNPALRGNQYIVGTVTGFDKPNQGIKVVFDDGISKDVNKDTMVSMYGFIKPDMDDEYPKPLSERTGKTLVDRDRWVSNSLFAKAVRGGGPTVKNTPIAAIRRVIYDPALAKLIAKSDDRMKRAVGSMIAELKDLVPKTGEVDEADADIQTISSDFIAHIYKVDSTITRTGGKPMFKKWLDILNEHNR